jgi:hypothetical protein
MNRIVIARSKWRDAINSKNLYSLLGCYNKEHTFKGTMNDRVTVQTEDTKRYFTQLLEKNPTVVFTKSEIQNTDGVYIDSGTYVFCMVNKESVTANYQFVYTRDTDNPKIISHFSSKVSD